MSHRMTHRSLLGLAMILAILPAAARAQEGPPLDIRPHTIQAQLEASLRLQRMALQRLDTPSEAARLAWDAYVMLRAAHQNLQGNIQHSKFPNPLFQVASPKLQTARDHLLWARSMIMNPDRVTDGNPTERAAERLRQSSQLIELVLITSF